MIWLAWRQFRVQALAALGALAVLGTVLLITGPHLVHLYDTTVANCSVHGNCSVATAALISDGDRVDIVLRVIIEVVPALIGLFWGAPLVARELETGTYRLAWTQVTRTRWMVVKISLLGLSTIAVAGLLSLMVTWWSSPLDRVRMTPFTSFDQRDLVPVGYAAFAFVLGVTAGVLIRRTLPAMATALGSFVAARLVVAHWGRPNFVSRLRIAIPDRTIAASGTSTASAGAPDPRDWVISDQTINAKGKVIGQFGSIGPSGNTTVSVGTHGITVRGAGSCPNLHSQTPQNVQRCVDQLRIREVLTFQPISHYWALQWCELAIFLGAAIALSAFCLWWVRRRVA
ncbi:MAG: hypothetical protein ABSG36_15255 [Acidimicrobiales bacterium]